jgi:membrane protein DedA with SNARE-associated domain
MLHDLVEQYGPALIFANVLAGALGLPVPAMPSLVLFGAMAAMHPGSVGTQLLPVLILSIFATLIGDSVWYLAGRIYGGNTLKTICRLSLSRDTCVKKTERFFGRWGVRVLAVAKFVPGLSIVSIPMAGAMGTRYRTFLTYDSIGAALWSGTGLIIGALFSRHGGPYSRRAVAVVRGVPLDPAPSADCKARVRADRSRRTGEAGQGGRYAGTVRYPFAGEAQARSIRDPRLEIR